MHNEQDYKQQNIREIKGIVSTFEGMYNSRLNSKQCVKIFCTTCGGLAYHIQKNIGEETRNKISKLLDVLSEAELIKFGIWRGVIAQLFPDKYEKILEENHAQILHNLDLSTPSSIDRYLLKYRDRFKHNDPNYKSIVAQGLRLALETQDKSLIETMIIVLGDEANNHPDLISLAIEESKSDKQLERVLYNKLRHIREDVRSFKGPGYTVHPFDW